MLITYNVYMYMCLFGIKFWVFSCQIFIKFYIILNHRKPSKVLRSLFDKNILKWEHFRSSQIYQLISISSFSLISTTQFLSGVMIISKHWDNFKLSPFRFQVQVYWLLRDNRVLRGEATFIFVLLLIML